MVARELQCERVRRDRLVRVDEHLQRVPALFDGRRDLAWPAGVLAGGVREGAATVVAARGLTLEEVRYPSDDELWARTEQTRRRRDEPDAS